MAAGFEADVGGDVAASVAEVAGLGMRVASVGLAQVFQDKARSAQLADKLVPAVQVLDRARLSVSNVGRRGQRAFVVILNADHVIVVMVAADDLQTRWLLVLADVNRVVFGDASDLAINAADVLDVARTDRLVHDVEVRLAEFRQVVHRRLDAVDFQVASFRFALIQSQHRRAEIHDGNIRPGGGVKDRLPAASARQAKHVQAGDVVRQPAASFQRLQRILQLFVGGDVGKLAAGFGQTIPRSSVLIDVGHEGCRLSRLRSCIQK